jgi:hypothetical protein
LQRGVGVGTGDGDAVAQGPSGLAHVRRFEIANRVGQVRAVAGTDEVAGSGCIHLGELVEGGEHQVVDERALGEDEAAEQHPVLPFAGPGQLDPQVEGVAQ